MNMKHQEKMTAKKRGRPAIGKGVQVVVRLQPDLLRPLDAWISRQDPPVPTRPAVLRLALKKWLMKTDRKRAAVSTNN
jgi:hypothetical protein